MSWVARGIRVSKESNVVDATGDERGAAICCPRLVKLGVAWWPNLVKVDVGGHPRLDKLDVA